MNDVQRRAQEQRVLRWGGLAGVVGSLLFIVVFVIVGVFVGTEFVEVMTYPDVRTARIVEEVLYLAVLILWVIHSLALYRALRERSLAPALFGSVIGVLGLAMLVADALRHIWQTPISDLYHAPGAPPEAQATLVLLWQVSHGIFDTLLITGLILLPIMVIALGMAMFNVPAFGTGFGRLSVALGLVALGAAAVMLVDPRSLIAVVDVFALIIFHLILGWKVFKLSSIAEDGVQGASRAGAPRR